MTNRGEKGWKWNYNHLTDLITCTHPRSLVRVVGTSTAHSCLWCLRILRFSLRSPCTHSRLSEKVTFLPFPSPCWLQRYFSLTLLLKKWMRGRGCCGVVYTSVCAVIAISVVSKNRSTHCWHWWAVFMLWPTKLCCALCVCVLPLIEGGSRKEAFMANVILHAYILCWSYGSFYCLLTFRSFLNKSSAEGCAFTFRLHVLDLKKCNSSSGAPIKNKPPDLDTVFNTTILKARC